ncbi:hypothetical protein ACLKA6_011313 [Drosophila palustris]
MWIHVVCGISQLQTLAEGVGAIKQKAAFPSLLALLVDGGRGRASCDYMQMRGEDAAATGVSNTLFAVQLLQRQDEHEKLQKEQQECKSISMRPARTCVNWAESCCRLRMHSTASAPCRWPSGGRTTGAGAAIGGRRDLELEIHIW